MWKYIVNRINLLEIAFGQLTTAEICQTCLLPAFNTPKRKSYFEIEILFRACSTCFMQRFFFILFSFSFGLFVFFVFIHSSKMNREFYEIMKIVFDSFADGHLYTHSDIDRGT